MQTISSLTEFLEATGCELHLYDIGRRVRPIPRDSFLAFEYNKCPYPLPLQQQAWFGLLFRNTNNNEEESHIWFIHFPLDEQGKLVLAARDDFMHRLVETLGDLYADNESNAKIQAAIQDNPHAFRPKPERMAIFHAKVTAAFNQPASRYYSHACDYFSGQIGWDQWTFLGYQGIADIAARLEQDDNQQRLADAIPQLPAAPLEALCHCLENVATSADIAQSLLSRTQANLAKGDPDPQILAACLRGIACARETSLTRALIRAVLSDSIASRSDILAAISACAWEVLLDEQIRDQYLERLADNNQGQEFFNGILSDLLFLPDTRPCLLASLRKGDRPKGLSEAIGRFFNNIKPH